MATAQVDLRNGLRDYQVAKVKSMTRERVGRWFMLLAAVGFVAAGAYTVSRGFDGRSEVSAMLKAEAITTPEDASIPNVPVIDGVTARSQADIIQKHALTATKGKTYAQMERTDPARQTALTASSLRTALLSAELAWNTATFVIGVGALIAAIGALMLLGLYFFRPAKQ